MRPISFKRRRFLARPAAVCDCFNIQPHLIRATFVLKLTGRGRLRPLLPDRRRGGGASSACGRYSDSTPSPHDAAVAYIKSRHLHQGDLALAPAPSACRSRKARR